MKAPHPHGWRTADSCSTKTALSCTCSTLFHGLIESSCEPRRTNWSLVPGSGALATGYTTASSRRKPIFGRSNYSRFGGRACTTGARNDRACRCYAAKNRWGEQPFHPVINPEFSTRHFSRDRSSLVAQRLSIPRLAGLERFMVEIRRRPLPRHGTDHDSKPLPSFPRLCLPARHFSADMKSIEVAVGPVTRSAPLQPEDRTCLPVIMRISYGFRTLRCLELALYHSLGKLPEPESTHEFFDEPFY
jgi:hypothetical protein